MTALERRLIVMRHAKSSWKSPGVADRSRPLNRRGERDAPKVGATLHELGWQPAAAFVSDATRTQQTWTRMAPAWPAPVPMTTVPMTTVPMTTVPMTTVPMTTVPAFYLGGLGQIRETAAAWNDEWSTVLVLGHNPGWEEAVSSLCGQPAHLSTGNAALLLGSGDSWSTALRRPWTLVDIIRPRGL